MMRDQAGLEHPANLEVQEVPLRPANRHLPWDRYCPEGLVAPESVGRNLQALPLSQSPRRRTRYALGDPSTAEGEPYYVAEHWSPQPCDGDVTHVRILSMSVLRLLAILIR